MAKKGLVKLLLNGKHKNIMINAITVSLLNLVTFKMYGIGTTLAVASRMTRESVQLTRNIGI